MSPPFIIASHATHSLSAIERWSAMIKNDSQLANTLHKLALLEQQIAQSRRQEESSEQEESAESLESLARQLKEEIVRYRSAKKLRNVG